MGALTVDAVKKTQLFLGASADIIPIPFMVPLDAATETFAVLGRRGSGKTHTAVVMAEEMFASGVQIVVLDPLDVWWGLRVPREKGGLRLPIYVVGGSHGDLELQGDSGGLFADVVVDRGLSMVFSLRHLSKADARRFVADFCERLYQRKGTTATRTACHVFIDEADAFVPQRLVPGSERCFGAVDTLVRRGRASGLAPTLISQRPQVINKDVLSQTEVMICHQLTGPQDRKALQAWTDAHDPGHHSKTFMESLASLKRGQCWVWSPGMLDVFARVNVRQRYTFDSSSTPKPGVASAQPEPLTPVDLKALGDQIAASQQKAKDDDPVALRKRIKELESMRDVNGILTVHAPAPAEILKEVKVESVPKAIVDVLMNMAGHAQGIRDHVEVLLGLRLQALQIAELPPTRTVLVTAKQTPAPEPEYHYKPRRGDNHSGVMAQALRGDPDFDEEKPGTLATGKSERKILTILAQHGSKDPVERSFITVMTGYTRGTRDRLIGVLMAKGHAENRGTGLLAITPAGIDALGPFERLPTGKRLLAHWLANLSDGEVKILKFLATFHENEWVSRDNISKFTGYTRGTRDRLIGVLMARKLTEKVEGAIRLSPTLR